jgi:hypothetical protein
MDRGDMHPTCAWIRAELVGMALGEDRGERPGDRGEWPGDDDDADDEGWREVARARLGSGRGETELLRRGGAAWRWWCSCAEHDKRLMERDRACLGEKGAEEEEEDDDDEVDVAPSMSSSVSSDDRRLLRVRAVGCSLPPPTGCSLPQPISAARSSSSYSRMDVDSRRSLLPLASCSK